MRREAGGARCEVRGATSVFEFVCVLPQLLRRPETCLQCYYEDNEDSSLEPRASSPWLILGAEHHHIPALEYLRRKPTCWLVRMTQRSPETRGSGPLARSVDSLSQLARATTTTNRIAPELYSLLTTRFPTYGIESPPHGATASTMRGLRLDLRGNLNRHDDLESLGPGEDFVTRRGEQRLADLHPHLVGG